RLAGHPAGSALLAVVHLSPSIRGCEPLPRRGTRGEGRSARDPHQVRAGTAPGTGAGSSGARWLGPPPGPGARCSAAGPAPARGEGMDGRLARAPGDGPRPGLTEGRTRTGARRSRGHGWRGRPPPWGSGVLFPAVAYDRLVDAAVALGSGAGQGAG